MGPGPPIHTGPVPHTLISALVISAQPQWKVSTSRPLLVAVGCQSVIATGEKRLEGLHAPYMLDMSALSVVNISIKRITPAN